jgi:hypothetical protein
MRTKYDAEPLHVRLRTTVFPINAINRSLLYNDACVVLSADFLQLRNGLRGVFIWPTKPARAYAGSDPRGFPKSSAPVTASRFASWSPVTEL